jgi:hypothetical protein
MHPQRIVDHRERIGTHPASADRMEDRRAELARSARERFFALNRGPRPEFLRLVRARAPSPP